MNKPKISLKISGKSGHSILLSVFLLPMVYQNVHAYIDPGTGTLIIQFLIAGAIGGFFLIKIFWGKVKTFLNNLFSGIRKDKG